MSLNWFNTLYRVLLGQGRGPRFGSFVAAYGIANTLAMIDGALIRAEVGAPTYVPPLYRYRLYFDETGNGSIRAAKRYSHDRYLSITGLVIRQDIHDAQVTEQLTKIKRDILSDASIILHQHEIKSRRGKFSPLSDENTRAKFERQLAELMRNIPATAITISIDKLALSEKQSRWPINLHQYTLMRLLEWFVLWLDRNGFYGDLIGEFARPETRRATSPHLQILL